MESGDEGANVTFVEDSTMTKWPNGKYIPIEGKTPCPDPENHWPELPATKYNYFSLDNEWYIIKSKDVETFLSLIEVDEAMCIAGAMQLPLPTRIDTQTEMIALLKKKGVTDEALSKFFDVSRMRGRVLKRLVKGKNG